MISFTVTVVGLTVVCERGGASLLPYDSMVGFQVFGVASVIGAPTAVCNVCHRARPAPVRTSAVVSISDNGPKCFDPRKDFPRSPVRRSM